MKLPLVAAVLLATATCPAAAGDADCERARDRHADFKAVFDKAPSGKPQFETVKHGGSDGIVTVTRWEGGEKRVVRTALRGVFTKKLEILFGAKSNETAFASDTDLSKLFPLRPNTSAQYRVSIGRSDRFDPKFADVKLSVGAAREIAIGGCKLPALDLVIDWRGTEAGATVSKTILTYVPALDYAIDTRSQMKFRGRDIDIAVKVRAIEAWSE